MARGNRGGPGIPRGRGRGGRGRGRGTPRGRGRGRGGFVDDDFEFSIYTYADSNTRSPAPPPQQTPGRGRGRARGYSTPNNNNRGGRGRGIGSPNTPTTRGRGGGGKFGLDAPLSGLLYQERPLLRPVIFVPSVYTRTLFQEEEDILKPVVEEVGEGYESHAPTANQIERLFSGRGFPADSSSSSSSSEGEDEEEEELEEVDFNDLSKLLSTPASKSKNKDKEEQFTGVFLSTTKVKAEKKEEEEEIEEIDFSELNKLVSLPSKQEERAISEVEEKFTGFVIDTRPSPVAPAAQFVVEKGDKGKEGEKGKGKKKRTRTKRKKKSPLGSGTKATEDNGNEEEQQSAARDAMVEDAVESTTSTKQFVDPAIVMAVRQPAPTPTLSPAGASSVATQKQATSVVGETAAFDSEVRMETTTFEVSTSGNSGEVGGAMDVSTLAGRDDMVIETGVQDSREIGEGGEGADAGPLSAAERTDAMDVSSTPAERNDKAVEPIAVLESVTNAAIEADTVMLEQPTAEGAISKSVPAAEDCPPFSASASAASNADSVATDHDTIMQSQNVTRTESAEPVGSDSITIETAMEVVSHLPPVSESVEKMDEAGEAKPVGGEISSASVSGAASGVEAPVEQPVEVHDTIMQETIMTQTEAAGPIVSDSVTIGREMEIEGSVTATSESMVGKMDEVVEEAKQPAARASKEAESAAADVVSDPAKEERSVVDVEAPTATDSLESTTLAAVEGQTAYFIDTKPTLSPADVPPPDEDPIPTSSAQEEQPVFVIDTQPTPVPGQEEKPVFVIDTQPAPVPESQEEPLFVIDTQPTPFPRSQAPSRSIAAVEEEEIIVYVAPHPRSSCDAENKDKDIPSSAFAPYVRNETLSAASASLSSSRAGAGPTAPPMSSLSFSFSSPVKQTLNRRQNPVRTPRATKKHAAYERKKAKRAKRSAYGAFSSYGAMMEEAALRGRDRKFKERRRGDSDLEWGSDDDRYEDPEDDDEEVFVPSRRDKGKGKAKEEGSFAAEGMEVDLELELDVAAMRSFASGLVGSSAGVFMSMDDVRDEEMIRGEDEEEVWKGSSGEEEEEGEKEVEEVFSVEEKMLIGEVDESDDDDDEDEDDSDDEVSPQRGFQARLERLRQRARERQADDSLDRGHTFVLDDSDEEDDLLERHMTWAEEDEEFLEQIEDIMAENEEIITGRDRKARNRFFNAIRDGDFDDMDSFGSPARRKKDKWKDVPPELQDQWEKDRQKKAERKRARELEKLEKAADALALKKGGKKGRKAMLAASRLDPTITVLPNRIIDMTTLVQQIKRFIAEIGGPNSMSLPPTNKETRKNIHEMAEAFGLKSVSKGKDDARYTTLHKTSRTGIVLNEKKISRIIRRSGGAGARGSQFVYTESSSSTKRGPKPVVPRHKEGDEVGKAAPKIGQSNIGFRMLASMGWSEGDRIGISGGLDAPLTAIIKNTKLGLGATR